MTKCNKAVINPGYVPRKRRTTIMKFDYRTPAEFGHLVGITDRAYVRLAVMAADMAARGRIESSNAQDVLMEFNEARQEARGIKLSDPEPGKQQVSKMRKVIECGERFGVPGVEMLEEASRLYLKEKYKQDASDNLPAGEYNAIVEVARRSVMDGKLLSVKDIVKVLKKEK